MLAPRLLVFGERVLLRGAVVNPGFGSEPVSFHQWSSKRFAQERWFQGSGHPKQLARCQRTDFAQSLCNSSILPRMENLLAR